MSKLSKYGGFGKEPYTNTVNPKQGEIVRTLREGLGMLAEKEIVVV